MEKEQKPASTAKNFLKFLPKIASSFSFHNPPFSPSSRDTRPDFSNASKLKAQARKGFSGSVVSIIPAAARRKPKNSSFPVHEPTSPKVSCMGQIKLKKKMKKEKEKAGSTSGPRLGWTQPNPKKKPSTIAAKETGRKSNPDGAPALGLIKRFASGRERLTGFDWSVQVAPVDSVLDQEREGEPIIPFSAPVLVGGGDDNGGVIALEPRKEINLWKRRTMAQPRPLQVN